MQTKVESYRTKSNEVCFDEEGILWLIPDEGTEMDLEEVTACFDTYKKMGVNKDNRILQIIDGRVNVTMNKEGREYAAVHGKEYFIASAVISTNLAVRLIVNFFNLFYKYNKVPLKMFDTEESARKWLEKFR